MISNKEAKELLDCIKQAEDRKGDWLVALERAHDLAVAVVEDSESDSTVTIDGLTIGVWRSSLEYDKGQPVVQIDGAGMLRVNVNDYPIWNADPDNHEHNQCQCVKDFEARD